MKKGLLFGGLIALVVACQPKTAEAVKPTETKTEVAVAFPSPVIEEGSKLYLAHCGSCHRHKVVENFTVEEWKKVMPPMAKKAKIDATQEDKITQFVLWKTQLNK
jgi:hypothetical protein